MCCGQLVVAAYAIQMSCFGASSVLVGSGLTSLPAVIKTMDVLDYVRNC